MSVRTITEAFNSTAANLLYHHILNHQRDRLFNHSGFTVRYYKIYQDKSGRHIFKADMNAELKVVKSIMAGSQIIQES